MRTGESDLHYALKLAAIAWAWNHGYKIIVGEHSIPALGEMDVYAIKLKPVRAVVIEAKASRSDFLCDFQDPALMASRASALATERENIHSALVFARDEYRVEQDPHRRAVLAAQVDAFSSQLRLWRLRAYDVRGEFGVNALTSGRATAYYVITPPGIVGDGEAPGWGLLEDVRGVTQTIRPSPRYSASPEMILSRLDDVARRATLNVLNLLGARWRAKKITSFEENPCASGSYSSPAGPPPARTLSPLS